MDKQDLFPAISPYESGFFDVGEAGKGERHEIYWEVSGNPDGTPVVFLHGGPGSGTSPVQRCFFDPQAYRIILFDQRGSGQSRPLGALADNTTDHLVADMEKLREHLGVGRWLVFGGSWGSTLSLAYAQAHPERVRGLILRGIFLSRAQEIAWFLSDQGMGALFPEAYEDFISLLPEAERDAPLAAYLKRLNDPDPAVHLPAARAWSGYEGACVCLKPDPEVIAASRLDERALSTARLEAHYFAHGSFLPEGGLLAGIGRIRHIPAVIVQGRYDAVCPIASAYDLHKAWPEADFQVVPDAGHSAMEPGIRRALVAATERFKHLA